MSAMRIADSILEPKPQAAWTAFTQTRSAERHRRRLLPLASQRCVLSVNPNLTRTALKKLLEDTADKVGPDGTYNAKGRSDVYGFGQVNAFRAVAAATTPDKASKSAAPTKAKAKAKSGKASTGRRKSRVRRRHA